DRLHEADRIVHEPNGCRREKGRPSAIERGRILTQGRAIKVPALKRAWRAVGAGEAVEHGQALADQLRVMHGQMPFLPAWKPVKQCGDLCLAIGQRRKEYSKVAI